MANDYHMADACREKISNLIAAEVRSQTENKERIRQTEVHMDFLTKQLERREIYATDQRKSLMKEIILLREQLWQVEKGTGGTMMAFNDLTAEHDEALQRLGEDASTLQALLEHMLGQNTEATEKFRQFAAKVKREVQLHVERALHRRGKEHKAELAERDKTISDLTKELNTIQGLNRKQTQATNKHMERTFNEWKHKQEWEFRESLALLASKLEKNAMQGHEKCTILSEVAAENHDALMKTTTALERMQRDKEKYERMANKLRDDVKTLSGKLRENDISPPPGSTQESSASRASTPSLVKEPSVVLEEKKPIPEALSPSKVLGRPTPTSPVGRDSLPGRFDTASDGRASPTSFGRSITSPTSGVGSPAGTPTPVEKPKVTLDDPQVKALIAKYDAEISAINKLKAEVSEELTYMKVCNERLSRDIVHKDTLNSQLQNQVQQLTMKLKDRTIVGYAPTSEAGTYDKLKLLLKSKNEEIASLANRIRSEIAQTTNLPTLQPGSDQQGLARELYQTQDKLQQQSHQIEQLQKLLVEALEKDQEIQALHRQELQLLKAHSSDNSRRGTSSSIHGSASTAGISAYPAPALRHSSTSEFGAGTGPVSTTSETGTGDHPSSAQATVGTASGSDADPLASSSSSSTSSASMQTAPAGSPVVSHGLGGKTLLIPSVLPYDISETDRVLPQARYSAHVSAALSVPTVTSVDVGAGGEASQPIELGEDATTTNNANVGTPKSKTNIGIGGDILQSLGSQHSLITDAQHGLVVETSSHHSGSGSTTTVATSAASVAARIAAALGAASATFDGTASGGTSAKDMHVTLGPTGYISSPLGPNLFPHGPSGLGDDHDFVGTDAGFRLLNLNYRNVGLSSHIQYTLDNIEERKRALWMQRQGLLLRVLKICDKITTDTPKEAEPEEEVVLAPLQGVDMMDVIKKAQSENRRWNEGDESIYRRDNANPNFGSRPNTPMHRNHLPSTSRSIMQGCLPDSSSSPTSLTKQRFGVYSVASHHSQHMGSAGSRPGSSQRGSPWSDSGTDQRFALSMSRHSAPLHHSTSPPPPRMGTSMSRAESTPGPAESAIVHVPSLPSMTTTNPARPHSPWSGTRQTTPSPVRARSASLTRRKQHQPHTPFPPRGGTTTPAPRPKSAVPTAINISMKL
eukprot:TRINITY_DN59783_c0_g1_i1.p1 TRINITY_DN59783_c0_g1~~TRINITY_DN59783_c0_g1_i1.p1  ORF type:complete len:1185 (+),score=128.51 TRINITY_DN59783_c0_g1_i1:108-3557(+)